MLALPSRALCAHQPVCAWVFNPSVQSVRVGSSLRNRLYSAAVNQHPGIRHEQSRAHCWLSLQHRLNGRNSPPDGQLRLKSETRAVNISHIDLLDEC